MLALIVHGPHACRGLAPPPEGISGSAIRIEAKQEVGEFLVGD
jgi:hypothetical protein